MENKTAETVKRHTNMELLAGSLQRRGFYVRYMENRLIPCPGSGRGDLYHLQELLDSVHIRAVENNQMLVLEEFGLTEEQVERIAFYKTYNHEAWSQAHLQSWKTFTKRKHGPKLDTLTLEPGVAYLVKQLGKAGILTEMSCDGHGKRQPCIWFAGRFSAAWFEILAETFIKQEGLHYRWRVKADSRNNRILTEIKPAGEGWNPERVQEDAMQLGSWFECHAEAVSAHKRASFKHRSMKAEAIRLSEDYDALKSWMESKRLELGLYTNTLIAPAN